MRERESKRTAARRESKEPAARRSPEEEKARRDEIEARKTKAIELAVDTFEDMIAVRGDVERIWASVLKEAIKRRNPGFNESYYGYKAFGTLLEDAAARGLIGFGRDEKSGAFVTRVTIRPVVAATITETGPSAPKQGEAPEPVPQDVPAAAKPSPRRRGRTGRKAGEGKLDASVTLLEPVVAPVELVQETTAEQAVPEGKKTKSKSAARPRRTPRKKVEIPAAD